MGSRLSSHGERTHDDALDLPSPSIYRNKALLTLCAVGLVSCTPTTSIGGRDSNIRTRGSARPNVLIVITDDQPLGTLGVMPETRRWFARGAVRFPNTFATTPMCCPSRSSIMTGRYAHNHGVKTNEDSKHLDPKTTVQKILSDLGYRTRIIGKYLNRWSGDPPVFDEWSTITGRHLYFEGTWNVNGSEKHNHVYRTHYAARKAKEFIESSNALNHTRPWFLMVAVDAPHAPYQPALKYERARVPKWKPPPSVTERLKFDKPEYVRQAQSLRGAASRVRTGQLRTLMSVDDLMSDLFRTLHATKERENTLVIFVSDNGYLWGDHGLLGAPISKGNPYTNSIKVPLWIGWPARYDGLSRDRRLVTNVDIAPTILDAVGGRSRTTDGRTLLDRTWRRRMVLMEFWQKKGEHRSTVPDWTSIRTRRYQYVEYTRDDLVIDREFYRLRPDPWQLHNLLGDLDRSNDPDVGRMHRLLSHAQRCKGTACP